MDTSPPHLSENQGIISGIIELFRRPFPVMEDWRMRWVVIAFHGLFITIFLLVFQPFQDVFFADSPYINAGFGIIVSLVLAFNHFLISKVLPIDLKKWTIGKSIAWTMYDVLVVILGVFIYKNFWTDFDSFTWRELWKITYSTVLLAIIPVMISTILLENWLLRRNLSKASKLQQSVQQQQPVLVQQAIDNPQKETLTLYSDNKSEWIKLRPKDLILLESADNYVNIHYRQDEKIQKKLLRSTLTKLEAQITDSSLVRCHRSYMVNLNQIKQVEGNSRGLQLELLDCPHTVPVSRKYVKAIQQQLSKKAN
jgi:hypothetical protein